ncbi:N-glycosylase/DNA lyase isoform X2 [Centroberyx affinis]|uniref:N-glycosylase/DNA lyase isoform X2 n=1 Tax=Centroberyx affinis TaxID=166261 RepID=UPI003A5C65BE
MAQHAVLSSGTKLWRSLSCSRSELRLDLTLGCGQTFRWRETAEGHWTGVMGGRVWTVTQTDDTLWYHVYNEQDGQGEGSSRKRRASDMKEETMLRDYFQLNVKLGDLYREWGAADPHFKHIANIFTGVRMLRQEPTECLFSFICTSNNHISRIQGMVERLCQSLGSPLSQLDQTSYYNFPSLSALAGDLFRKLWGPYAGWAHSVLFCADLKKFQKLKEMPRLKQEQQEEEKKVVKKKAKIKIEEGETVKKAKTKSACHREAKMSVKDKGIA